MMIGILYFSELNCTSKVVGTIVNVIYEVKWQLWPWICCFDLDGGDSLSALLDS